MPPFFRKPYKSEVTHFIEKLKADKPTLEDEQRAGRALLWDKAIDRDAQQAWRQARVPQQPYVYQPKSR
ncbi:acetyl-CoA carboxyl transferase [Rubrivivax gelatinosus]|nr:acetyl-CoA carboxyl transferase [Rubrivivax gelatinosus]